ncbi:MAG: DUF262 domain-containing HNH endonuclease family protein [Candidatus Aenigmatarchaeota archaeon]
MENFRFSLAYFQRNYSWGKDNWRQLLEDIIASHNENREHFFGFMCFYTQKELGVKQIIDGQQRIATLYILFSVIRDILNHITSSKKFSEDQQRVIREVITNLKYLLQSKPFIPTKPDEEIKYRLELSRINDHIFRNYILKDDSLEKKIKEISSQENREIKTNKLLLQCYKFFYSKINEILGDIENFKKIQNLLSVISHLLEKWYAVVVDVENLDEAYKIFVSLNATGLELTVSDLIKAYLLDKIKMEEERDKYRNVWEDITSKINNMSSFLRHYWLSKYSLIKEDELYNEIKKIVKDDKDAKNFIDEIRQESEMYYSILTGDINFFRNDREIIELLKDNLFILSEDQVMPILLSLAKKFNISEMKKAVSYLEAFIFRYLTIGERENKELVRFLSNISRDIRSGKIRNSKELREVLIKSNLYIEDKDFITLFKMASIKKSDVAKYILKKIENKLSGGKEKWPASITLEHILPKEPDNECKKYLEEKGLLDKLEILVHRIGNLTLLERVKNTKASNKPPASKAKEVYKYSELKINEDLKNITEWTEKEIQARQEKLAELAVNIWKI